VGTVSIDLQEHQSVRVTVGDVLEIRLVEQAGGGYIWSRTGLLPPGISETGERREHQGDRVGAAAMKVFQFSCDAEFTAELQFSLARPWMADQVEQIRTVSIVCVK
jgi:hypothetical protein